MFSVYFNGFNLMYGNCCAWGFESHAGNNDGEYSDVLRDIDGILSHNDYLYNKVRVTTWTYPTILVLDFLNYSCTIEVVIYCDSTIVRDDFLRYIVESHVYQVDFVTTKEIQSGSMLLKEDEDSHFEYWTSFSKV